MWPVLWVPRTSKYSELWGWGDNLRRKVIVWPVLLIEWPVLQAEVWMGSERDLGAVWVLC